MKFSFFSMMYNRGFAFFAMVMLTLMCLITLGPDTASARGFGGGGFHGGGGYHGGGYGGRGYGGYGGRGYGRGAGLALGGLALGGALAYGAYRYERGCVDPYTGYRVSCGYYGD